MLESLYNKVAGPKVCNFVKERLQRRCFPVNIYLTVLMAASFLLYCTTVVSLIDDTIQVSIQYFLALECFKIGP